MLITKLKTLTLSFLALLLVSLTTTSEAQVAVRAKKIYTMAGSVIEDGMIIVRDGKIAAIGKASDLKVPEGFKVIKGAIATPGLVDARGSIGLSGYYNQDSDKDQIERSNPIQPELRAIDAYNPHERLVQWVREFGVTTVQSGHVPGELISGQLAIFKTVGDTVDDAVIVKRSSVAATLSTHAKKDGKASPGTRGKMMSMLRLKLVEAKSYLEKRMVEDPTKRPPRNLGNEVLAEVLAKKVPLVVTAHKAQDIANAMRLAKEFDIKLVLDGASECYLLLKEIKARGISIILHPTMARYGGDLENGSFETASKLKKAGIPFAIKSGYEPYVPKTRIVLFEAAIAAANGLSFEEALASITIDAAKILGIDKRVGSLALGKDGDIAVYNGDPFEYTTHCTAVIINGKLVFKGKR